MKLSANFTLEEMCESPTATKLGIKNTPDSKQLENLKATCQYLLQPLRNAYGKGIKINSGFRCDKVNRAVGGAKTSSHMYGFAADIKPVDGNMKALQKAVLAWSKTHSFDQIIIEQPTDYVASWIHVGWKHGVTGKQRRQILYAKKVNGKWAYYVLPLNSKFYLL